MSNPREPLARLLTIASLSAALLAPGAARAEKDACITAYEETQTRRKDGKLLDAKREAAVCARAECPAMLVKDCVKWLGELDASIPTVVLDARTPQGAELTNVRVSVDGVVVAGRIDGKATSIDPGARTFRFESEGAPLVERLVVVREGEKHRKISVVLKVDPAARSAQTSARPIPLGVWIFGGVSAAALVGSAAFAIDGLDRKSDLDGCKPRCSASDVDAMSASFTMADVMLGAGVMAGLAAAWLYVTRPSTGEAAHVAKQRPRPQPWAAPLGAGGGAAGIGARF